MTFRFVFQKELQVVTSYGYAACPNDHSVGRGSPHGGTIFLICKGGRRWWPLPLRGIPHSGTIIRFLYLL